MNEQEIINLLSKSYRNLSRNYTKECKQEWFIINKFKELFGSKNYLDGRISDRIIKILFDTFKKLHVDFYLEGLKCVNIFDLLMCKDYASGKITEDEVINIIGCSREERPSLGYRFYYDDSTRVYSALVDKLTDNNDRINASILENALKIKNKLEVYEYVPLLLSDNFQNGIIDEFHLSLIGKIPKKPYFSKEASAVNKGIKVLISDNYKEGLITTEHLRLFSTPEVLSRKGDYGTQDYVIICNLISFLLTSDDFKTGQIKDEDIIVLLNALINRKNYIAESVDRFLKFISTRNYKKGKVSISYLAKFIELGCDNTNLYEVLASDNFYDGLVTEEQINELYDSKSFFSREILLWILKSKLYRDNMIDYEELKKLANSTNESNQVFIDIITYILEESLFDDDTKGKYISILLQPEVFSYICGMKLEYEAKQVCDSNDFIKYICLFSLPVVMKKVYL